jgi:hypothetical protein
MVGNSVGLKRKERRTESIEIGTCKELGYRALYVEILTS